MNEDNNKTENKKPTIDLSRRRLAKIGLLSAPILAILPGKPAMALYNKNNCTVSGNLSGNMSDNSGVTDPCDAYGGGHLPFYWESNVWPVPYLPTDSFDGVFIGASETRDLSVVLADISTPLEAHAIAALFNAVVYADYGMSPADVVNLYLANYFPPAGVNAVALEETYLYLNSKR